MKRSIPFLGPWILTALVLATGTLFPRDARCDDKDAARDSLEPKLVYMATKVESQDECTSATDHAAYAFRLEKEAGCYLWGRMYFPSAPGSNDPNSFWVRVDEGAPRKFGNSLGGSLAPVLVPHVADDDCGLFGIPLDFVLHDPEPARIIRQRLTTSRNEKKWFIARHAIYER